MKAEMSKAKKSAKSIARKSNAVAGAKRTQDYSSTALAAVHEIALGLYEAGVMDKQTLRKFDELCLTAVKPRAQSKSRLQGISSKKEA